MAEGFLRWHAADAGVDAHVHSAGLLEEGRVASAEGVQAMSGWGIDTSAHRSRRLTPELVAGADLVIGMAREHVREATLLVPEAFPRAFTLKELVRRGTDVGLLMPGQPLDEWLAKVSAGRRMSDLLGSSADDDVADPIGQPLASYEATATELDDLTARLVLLLGWRQ
jgi:protein-tyrosine phosphatase